MLHSVSKTILGIINRTQKAHWRVLSVAYQIKSTGSRVMLNVLANCDKSVVGLEVANSKIISMNFSDLRELVISLLGPQEINNFDLTLFKYHTSPIQRKDGTCDDTIIVMETIEDSEQVYFEPNNILDVLKLYQATDIFSCYLFSYRVIDGELKGGGMAKLLLREHAIHWPPKTYKMTDESKTSFYTWFKSHNIIHSTRYNEKFKQMLRLYLDSYLPDDSNQSFIMLTIVLEMLFGSTVELTYRISRGAGVFLSNDREGMRKIVSSVKRLYTLRSKYVHEGKSIPWDALFELREIVRRTIVLMYEREMCNSEFDFKVFSEEITYDGYFKESQ